MRARHADRIWKIAGATVIVLLAVAGWFLLIGPKYAERDAVKNQTDATQTQLMTLRNRINQLKKQQSQLTALQAALAQKQTALPSDSGLPDFLNQLQRSGTATDVNVTGITVGAPVQQANLTAVWALPITLTADGSTANLERFLTSLQTGHARAVLIESASLTPKPATAAAAASPSNPPPTSVSANPSASPSASPSPSPSASPSPSPSDITSASAVSISLTLKAFVAPPAGAGAPNVTTK